MSARAGNPLVRTYRAVNASSRNSVSTRTVYRQLEAAKIEAAKSSWTVYAHRCDESKPETCLRFKIVIWVPFATCAKNRPLSPRGPSNRLVDLPEGTRKEAWEEAKAESNGKPTAAKVKAVVNRKLGKPAQPRATARARSTARSCPTRPTWPRRGAAGKIGADVVPEIDEPDLEPFEPTPEPEPEEPDDATWLASLPLHGKLTGACARWFEIDALLYRTLEDARRTFLHHANRALAVARRKSANGEYGWRVSQFLRLEHPKHWHLCNQTEAGGCGGTGTIGMLGQCPRCHGRGYWIQ